MFERTFFKYNYINQIIFRNGNVAIDIARLFLKNYDDIGNTDISSIASA